MEFKINEQDIEIFVKEAVLKAGIGQFIQKGINDALAPNKYDNPIDKSLKEYIYQLCGQIIKEKYEAQIKEAVSSYVLEKLTPELINATAHEAVTRIIKKAEQSY